MQSSLNKKSRREKLKRRKGDPPRPKCAVTFKELTIKKPGATINCEKDKTPVYVKITNCLYIYVKGIRGQQIREARCRKSAKLVAESARKDDGHTARRTQLMDRPLQRNLTRHKHTTHTLFLYRGGGASHQAKILFLLDNFLVT